MEYIPSLLSPIDISKPSLFELLSEAQLSALIPPSIRYLFALATHRHPRYLLRILNSFDEVYALLSLAVEKYYLETFGGTFTENFYSLKREKVLRIQGGELPRAQLAVPGEVREKLKLSSRGDIWKNLAVVVGVPYLKRKLDESYDVHVAPSASLVTASGPQYLDRDALPDSPTLKQRWMWLYKKFLRRCYPTLNACYYFGVLAFSLAYLFDGTKYSSPFLWMIGARMRRMGDADYKAIEKARDAASAASAAAGRPGQGLSGMLSPRTLYPRLLSSLRILLPTSIFALKFLEWWHASDFSRQLSKKAAEGLELPPPVISGIFLGRWESARREDKDSKTEKPSASRPDEKDAPISSPSYLPIFTVPPPPSSDLCPICLHPISTAAACQTGYVYDYRCIFEWIEGNHERQRAFMRGERMNEWDDEGFEEGDVEPDDEDEHYEPKSREGKWEDGKGRCAVTGQRVLGGTSGLRRVMV